MLSAVVICKDTGSQEKPGVIKNEIVNNKITKRQNDENWKESNSTALTAQ